MNAQPVQQIPGVYHRKIGDVVVTAISDGYLDSTLDVMRNVDRDKAKQILTDAFRPARRTSVNTFLIHSKGRTAIVDTGSGNYMQPSAGKVQQNLAGAGIDPKSIDTVLLTHMHPDHSAGLTDMTNGKHVSERRTRDARERIAALVRRRRHGEGERARQETLLPGRPRTGRALQEANAAVHAGRS